MKGWIEECVSLCRPDRVHICDGSQGEWERIAGEMVKAGVRKAGGDARVGAIDGRDGHLAMI